MTLRLVVDNEICGRVTPDGRWICIAPAGHDGVGEDVNHYFQMRFKPEAGEGAQATERTLPLHRTEAGWPRCSTCDGGGCPDCTDPS